MNLAERIVGRVNQVAEIMVIAAYAVLIVAISVAVFFRYVLNNSLVWAEELARYLFIWVTFVGAGLGVGKNVHVGVDAVTRTLPSGARWRVRAAVNIGVMGFVLVLIVFGGQLAVFGMGNRSLAMEIPMAYVYMAVPVGGTVMLANAALETWDALRGGPGKR